MLYSHHNQFLKGKGNPFLSFRNLLYSKNITCLEKEYSTLGIYSPERHMSGWPIPHVTQWEGQGGTPRGCAAIQRQAQAGEMGFMKFNKWKYKVLHPGRNNPMHQGRVCGLTGWKALLQQRSQRSWGTPSSPGTRNLVTQEEIMESIAQSCRKSHPVVFNSWT